MSTVRIVRMPAHAYVGGAPAGYLFGTTHTAGSPDTPVTRRVHLVAADNPQKLLFPAGRLVAWKLSDAAGNWRFDNLDPAKKYHVIAYDHTGVHDPVVKMNLVPSVEE